MMSQRRLRLLPPPGERVAWLLQAARFAVVGVSNTLLDLALFSALLRMRVPPVPANVVSYGISIAWSYYFNRAWTFRGHGETKTSQERVRTAVRFVAVSLTGLVLSTSLIRVFVAFAPPVVAKIATVPFVFAWGFLLSKLYVFTSSKSDIPSDPR